MTFYIIFLFFLFLFFIPIPIQITASYSDSNFRLLIYKKEIYALKKVNKKKEKAEKAKDELKEKKKWKVNILGLISSINNNRFKPKININIVGSYFIEDCYYTAILYGVIHQLIAAVNLLFSIPFTVKEVKYNINPTFKKQDNHIDGDIICIIYLSLVKVIYILILLVKNINFGGRLRNVNIRPKPSN